MKTEFGEIEVVEWIEKDDGSALLKIEISEEFKNNMKKILGWKRWSNKKFQVWVIECIEMYMDRIEKQRLVP